MKEIRVGEKNDVHLFAVEADGRYYPLTKLDLHHEKPDVKIYYDSGIYPSIIDIEQYICDKAKQMA